MPTLLRAFRLLALVPIATLAATAPALTLNLKSAGVGVDYDDSLGGGDFILGADEANFLVQETTPAAPDFTDAYLGLLRLGGVEDGSIAYRDGLNENALNVHLTVDSDVEANGVRTVGGSWEYLSGLGDYSDFSPKTSTGLWSFVWTRAGDKTRIELTGELKDHSNPTPEPAPFAVLGLGVLARMRRKPR